MSFHDGEIVRIGKGKVEYKVRFDLPASPTTLNVESLNTGKVTEVETLRLFHVRDAEPVHASEDTINAAISAGESFVDSFNGAVTSAMDEIGTITDAQNEREEIVPLAQWEMKTLREMDPKRPVILLIDNTTTQHKSFGAAADAFVLYTRDNPFSAAYIAAPGRKMVKRVPAA